MRLLWNDLTIPVENAAIIVPPLSRQPFSVFSTDPNTRVEFFNVDCHHTSLCIQRRDKVEWITPLRSGNYPIKVDVNIIKHTGSADRVLSHESFTITGIVSIPSYLAVDGVLNGFTIGMHPLPGKDSQIKDYYKPPPYYFELNRQNWGCHISEHFRLGDFGYDNDEDLPQYSALDYEIVKKMELLQNELRAWGLPSTFSFIGGGYISPKNNIIRCRRNRAAASMSRHMFGDAIDFIIDDDRDGVMDDMNGDGLVNVLDAMVVRDLVDIIEQSARGKVGGVGMYSPPWNTRVQLHVDTRGYAARWGPKATPDTDPLVPTYTDEVCHSNGNP